MADDSATQLEKLEATRKKAAAALAEADAQLANFRNANRGAKLIELKQDIANYGFTAVELFGEAALPPAKPKAKAKAKRGPAVVKYQDEQGNTWGGGKGPRPKWIVAIQEAGGDVEKYRVKDAAAPDRKAAAQRLVDAGGKAPDIAEVPRKRSN